MTLPLTVYLAGEVHTDWREQIIAKTESRKIPVAFLVPVMDHPASDNVGTSILGEEDKPFWKDHKGGKINSIRTRNMIKRADIVVVKFGDQYRQWNAAFDAGYAAASGKSIITLHDDSLTHALKEVDGAAHAVATTPEQVVEILQYVSTQR